MVVRRRVAAAVGTVVVILILLAIAGALGGGGGEAAATYAKEVSQLERESAEGVGNQFFQALAGARSEKGGGGTIEQRLNELGQEAERQAAKARALAVPSGLEPAEQDLLMALDLRSEAIRKVAGRIGTALAGGNESATAYKQIAGAMEILLASDVLYLQRVVPLIDESLEKNHVQGVTPAGQRFLPNLGWLEPATVAERLGGQLAAVKPVATGSEPASITAVSVGSNQLAPAPELNHIHAGSSPTFTVHVENSSSVEDTDVTVEVSVVAGGKRYSSFNVIPKVAPGSSATTEIPLQGLPQGVGAKITVQVQPPPGAQPTEASKATYEAVFG